MTDHQLLTLSSNHSRITHLGLFIIGVGPFLLLGCPTDTAPLEQENFQLKKQVAKLESVVFSLQEGNKVTQQQIDLLNREARKIQAQHEQELKKAQQKVQHLSQGHEQENHQLQDLKKENKKLLGDARWLRTQRDHMRKSLQVQKKGGKEKKIGHPFLRVIDVVRSLLARNGYTILASMQTDQKAIYLTNRKTSPPASLEVTGFRNQYLLEVRRKSEQDSTLWIKADFEKFSQQGQLLDASSKEIHEIETRLILEIQQILSSKQKSAGTT